MNNKVKIKLLIISFFSCYMANSYAEDIYPCPEKIEVASAVQNIPAGWSTPETTATNTANHYLTSVGFTDGPPRDKAFLKPAKIVEIEEGVYFSDYDLSSSVGGGSWLVCRYGNTAASITKKMPKDYSSCQVTMTKDTTQQQAVCR
ncbi:hypothetical protein L4C36_23705 [Photobacterium japonica]|uniref:STY0301 family protein n=1 Tax=Photobacterium japonica TaxID=2910235 RepID=UPI003D11993C